MTIPSLGGNSKFNVKPITNDVVSSEATHNIENVASNNNFIDLTKTNTQDEIKYQEPEQKEYSIQQFKKDYNEILANKVLSAIAPYEAERKKRRLIATTFAVIFGILAVITFLFCDFDRHGRIPELCLVAAGGTWYWIKKSFEKKIKLKIMPKLMQAFQGFYWQQTSPILKEEIDNIKIFPNSQRIKPKFDDAFVGSYRDVEICISECELGSGQQSLFEGAIIRLKMNKTFEGLTVLRPKKTSDKDLKKLKLEKIELEDTEFNKIYKTWATDQIESRYLLTTAFMERLKNIGFAFKAKGVYCVFYNKYVYIAPYVKDDLFNLFSLRKPVTDTRQFDVMFDQIVSVLQLVDYFKLDKKLGL